MTERKRAQNSPPSFHRNLAMVLDNTPDAIVRLNRRGQILYANAATRRVIDWPLEALLGKTIRELSYAKDLVELWEAGLRDVIKHKAPQILEYCAPGPKSATYWEARYFPELGSGGSVASVLLVARDITTRKLAECREHARAAELKAILDLVPAAIVMISDPDDGDVIGNEMAHTLARVPHDHRVSVSTWDRINTVRYRAGGQEIKTADLPVRKAARMRQGIKDVEFELVLDSGQVVNLRGSAVPLSTPGAPRGAVGAFVDVTELRAKERELQASRDRMRVLSDRLLTLSDEENRRLAQGLHDNLSQKLALLAFEVQSLAAEPPAGAGAVRERLRHLHGRVTSVSDDVRNLAYRLHPSVVDDLGLPAALRDLCDEFSDTECVDARFTEYGDLADIPPATAASLYRIAQQALHNVAKHSESRTAVVAMGNDGHSLELTIADAGIGFEPARITPGFGLLSIEERTRRLSGVFRLEAHPGQGTRIIVRIPVHRAAAAPAGA